jgi:hypothetical protein
VKKRKNITAIKVKKSKMLNLMSQNIRMRNKSATKRKANKGKILRSKKRILRRKTKILRNKIKKSSRSKVVSLVIAGVKVAITVMIKLFRKKSTCMPSLNFMAAEVAVSSMIIGLLITRSILILKISITSKDDMIIIQDSNIVMMISMPLISLFIIEEGEVMSIIMIGHNIRSHIKFILLLWEGFKVKDITKKDLSQLLMDKGVIMSKMIDSTNNSKVKMKE